MIAITAVIATAAVLVNIWVACRKAAPGFIRGIGIAATVFFGVVLWRLGIPGPPAWRVFSWLPESISLIGILIGPLALAALLVRIGLRRSTGSYVWLIQHNVALALVVLLLLRMLPEPAHGEVAVAAPAADTPTIPSPVSAKPREIEDPLIVLEALGKSGERMLPEDWEVTARAQTLTGGVDAAFALVRDEIAFEPYAGVMRGAWSAYISRAANAADRALLLAALLAVKNIRTRFAIGTLDTATQQRLFARVFETPVNLPSRPAQFTGFPQRVFARTERDYARVRGALGDLLRPVTNPTRADVLAEMNPHVWLQAEVNGTWVDLDPSFTDSLPGSVYAALERTVNDLPREQYQTMTIRLVGEYVAGGNRATRSLLEVVRPAVDLIDRQIAVVHTPAQGFGGLGFAIGGAIGAKREMWRPVLSLSGDAVAGPSFDASDPKFVAEWLEFELAWPGGRREVTRRSLVDRAPAGWREQLPLNAQTLRPLDRDDQGALSMQAVHNIWFSAGQHDLADYNLAVREALIEQLRAGSGEAPSSDLGQSLWQMALANFLATIWTDHVALPLVNANPGVRLITDGPRIAVFSAAPDGEGGTERITDLRRDGLRGVAVEGREIELAEAKLRFGISQGAMEHELAAEFASAAYGLMADVSSTSSLLASGPLRAHVEDRRIVVSSDSDIGGARWEITVGTGDCYAIGDIGLHSVRDKPLKGIKQGSSTPKTITIETRTPGQIRADNAKKKLDEVRSRKKPASPPKAASPSQAKPEARGGGSEYAIVLLVGIVSKMAIFVMTSWVEAKIYEEIEKAVEWIHRGGFARAIGREPANP